jgi:3-hydroxyacyl-CoA dehydrogenase
MAIRKAAVLGAGVMGSAIAAHLANASIPTLLLDIVPREPDDKEKAAGLGLDAPEVRNRLASSALEMMKKASPAPFAHADRIRLVTPGNFEDDLGKLADVDWVVEAVVERLDIKEALFTRVAPHLKPGALLTTNTSGLSLEAMAAGLPEALRPRFFGTHFFNPPRYMHLLEIIPASSTSPDAIDAFERFAEERLGKGVVRAKDTPNFVANRIGVFTMLYALRSAQKNGLTVEGADALTGKPMGRPKSATFGTADLVGIDVLAHVARTQREAAVEPLEKEICTLPEQLEKMIREGRWGRKSGAGFFKMVKENGKKTLFALDLATDTYRPSEKTRFPVLDELKEIADPGQRLAHLCASKGPAGAFSWDLTAETLLFAARRVGEICDDIVSLDRAMKWGFGWDAGPFELWDGLGVAASVALMEKEGRPVPEPVKALASSPVPSFYFRDGAVTKAWDFRTRSHVPVPPRHGVIVLSDLKRAGRLLYSNAEASIVDLGDRVACVEFHSKMNALGGGIITALQQAEREAGGAFDALVVGNQGENFSVGANLMLILFEALEGNAAEIDLMVRTFQKTMMGLKYGPVPVVAAPFGRVLGGGVEVCLHCHRIQAAFETYMGLVEVGVGVIPAGGGTKEMLLRAMARRPAPDTDPMPFVKHAFETIGMAKVSMGALEARDLGFLREGDAISMNADRLIHDAKRSALALLESGWQPLQGPAVVQAMGEDGLANIRSALYNLRKGGYITDHDGVVAEKLGRILCGGEVTPGRMVDENYLLDLERRAFLELCAERKTLERMRAILQTGKPLRN